LINRPKKRQSFKKVENRFSSDNAALDLLDAVTPPSADCMAYESHGRSAASFTGGVEINGKD
jgi:hypothetical protein